MLGLVSAPLFDSDDSADSFQFKIYAFTLFPVFHCHQALTFHFSKICNKKSLQGKSAFCPNYNFKVSNMCLVICAPTFSCYIFPFLLFACSVPPIPNEISFPTKAVAVNMRRAPIEKAKAENIEDSEAALKDSDPDVLRMSQASYAETSDKISAVKMGLEYC